MQGIRQNWNRHLTSSVPKQEQVHKGFFNISTYGAFRRGSCSDFELISSSLCYSPYKEESREAKIHRNRSETPPNAIKTQVIHRTEPLNRFYYFFLILNYFARALYSYVFPYKTLIITLLRNTCWRFPKELWVPMRKRYLNGDLNISSATW